VKGERGCHPWSKIEEVENKYFQLAKVTFNGSLKIMIK
jgi:hypothetical protein